MIPIESSNIAAVGHDPETGVMRLDFKRKDGGIDPYASEGPVPRWLYEDLLESESKGRYFQMSIKPAYRFKKISC